MKDRFFAKLDWAAFFTATMVTFLVYALTLGPSVGLEDSGELATAAAHLGVPHPPGYPFWTLCSWIFCKLFGWVTYMGHPTPAWCVSLCSAFFGALAAGCTAMLICRSSRDFIATEDGDGKGLLSFFGGVAGALTFSLSPVEWSQSTIVEIYSLNAFFLMAVFLLSYRWLRKPSDRVLWTTAFVFGLGLTNYQVLLFAIVPLALIILMKNAGMFRDVFTYLAPVALTYQILQIGSLQRANAYMQSDVIAKHAPLATVSTPSTALLVVASVLFVGAIVAAAVLARRDDAERAKKALLYVGGGAIAIALLSGFVFTGAVVFKDADLELAPLVSPRVYVAVAALVAGSVIAAALAVFEPEEKRFSNPAKTKLLGVSAALAAAAVLVAVLFVAQADLAGYRGPAYPWAKSTFMFLGVLAALFAMAYFTPNGLAFAIPVAGFHLAAFILLHKGAMNGLTHPASWWFWWPVVWNFVLLALTWLTLPNGRSVAGAAFFAQLGVSFYVYMPIVSDLRNPPMNWGYPRTWEGFKHAIQRGQYEAIGFPKFAGVFDFLGFFFRQMWHYFGDVRVQFTDLLIPFAFVPFAAGHWIVAKTHRKTFWQWMGAAAVCFLMMSGLLILLAQVKGDVQDGFIQKVKFISSHAMIALWIGYGIVFAIAGVAKLLAWRYTIAAAKLNRGIIAAGAVALVVALVYPIVQNWTDERMVFELGGNEQSGHTFGWQFGAYQLDGAAAIREQLVADEEPLPDPEYPPRMEDFAIFFGGTDPGRFVPTYMIYSADFRPDVYLITQNALADDTYMSVERDLYGDEIWIPSKEDSAEAFNIYVDEVKRGVRQANGDLKIENGRVQVTGALGVMEINGILTKMMFDKDRERHAFYVEESYAIPWMYLYLSPHGLIMKINKDKTPYDPKTAAKDRDFWDWYTRRLLKDPMYRRDFAGQKSFSKLRAALAGLYSKQGRRADAAQAFREAVMLYPASPEAVFRYAQEILLPTRRFDVAMESMDYTDAIDPNNKRTARLREYVTKLREVYGTISALEPKRREKKLDHAETARLAMAYYNLGRVMEAAQLVRPYIDTSNDEGELHSILAIVREAGLDADVERIILKLLGKNPQGPGSVDLWLDLAKIQQKTGRKASALRSFRTALQLDRSRTAQRAEAEDEIFEIAKPLMRTN